MKVIINKIRLLGTILISITLFACSIPQQEKSNKEAILKDPSSFFPQEKAQVLFVGLFHFDYPGLDVNVTDKEDQIDVLKEPKKSELTELVNYIKRFNPTKIALEATPRWNATKKLKQYKLGELRDKRDERVQVGLRIASDLNLDTLYSIDAWGFADQLGKIDSAYASEFFKDFDFQSEDPLEQNYKMWFDAKDKMAANSNLLDYVKYINSEENFNYNHGAYLIGDFKLGDYRGADITALWWYSRNLRIFRNIQNITEEPTDRILVIFGSGHGPILKHLIESSPEYHFVPFQSLD